MATDVFVNQLQRIGDTSAGLIAPQAAVVFDASTFVVADDPDTITTGQGSITGRTVVSLASGGVAALGYVIANLDSANSMAAIAWHNDTGASRTISHLYWIPSNTIAANGGSYWRMFVRSSNASGTITQQMIDTSATSWTAYAPIALSSIVVGAGETLEVALVPRGSPTAMSGAVQGR